MNIGIQALGSLRVVDPARKPEETEKQLRADYTAIKEAGFDAIDFGLECFLDSRSLSDRSVPCFFDRPMEELEEYFLPYRELCAESGLEISQTHAPFEKCVEEGERREHYFGVIEKAIRLTGFLKVPYCVVHPIIMRRLYGPEKEWKDNTAMFKRLVPVAKESGVMICLENMFDRNPRDVDETVCSGADEAVRYLDELNDFAGEERFGFCFDLGHAALMRRSPRDYIKALGGRLKILHLHDNDGTHDFHALPFTFVAAWGGPYVINWDGLIEGLSSVGYDGTLSFEAGPGILALPEPLKQAGRVFTAECGKYIIKQLREV
ncbi:MAG: sugar phosphate isomerase/epimerase [Lachnospiraceae bacterium]|nr:sugar phosphate isomerase/epimerase [Lachnospiraceae bacterium]